tara:strand:- start:1730 stop:2170 length:441 start_codon:yes stop_codon:yes gene_type:complete
MASLISDDEKKILTGVFGDVFDTFKRQIDVYKEPVKTIDTINESALFGYGEEANITNYTYTVQSGSFSGVISYQDKQDQNYYSELNGPIPMGDVRIKVQQDCRDFIANGKTEKIEFDGKSWNVISDDSVQRFLDSTFYVYYLERAK